MSDMPTDWRSEAIKAFRETMGEPYDLNFTPDMLFGVRASDWLHLQSLPDDPDECFRMGHINGVQVVLTPDDVFGPFD